MGRSLSLFFFVVIIFISLVSFLPSLPSPPHHLMGRGYPVEPNGSESPRRQSSSDVLRSFLLGLALRLLVFGGLRLFLLGEESLVLLLGREESILESVGIWRGRLDSFHAAKRKGDRVVSQIDQNGWAVNILSELAKRIARVTASGSPSLTSAAAFQTQLRSLPTLGDSFMSGTTR